MTSWSTPSWAATNGSATARPPVTAAGTGSASSVRASRYPASPLRVSPASSTRLKASTGLRVRKATGANTSPVSGWGSDSANVPVTGWNSGASQ